MGRCLAVAIVLMGCGDNRVAVVDAANEDGASDAAICATLVCDDGDPCTNDVCDGVDGCRFVSRDRCAEPLCMLGACAGTDTDGDGLSDAVEGQGYVDLDCDGAFRDDVDLELPHASTTRPTIYLEYDYMSKPGAGNACTSDASCGVAGEQCLGTCSGTTTRDCAIDSECSTAETCVSRVCTHSHRPTPAALALVVAAFTARDIDLVIEASPTRLVETDVVTFDPTLAAACVGPSAADFFVVKAANFDTRRRDVYHYVIFGHHATCSSGSACVLCPDDPLTNAKPPFGASGTAEVLGNDFIVSLARRYFDFALPHTVESEAGTLMHELGHNLGLKHGGNESAPEGKPNYISVMNRAFQFTGITSPTTGTRVDFSGATLNTLDEAALVELVGINEAEDDPLHGDDVTHFTNGQGLDDSGPGTGGIDWSGLDGVESGTLGAAVDINSDGSFSSLTGFNDWLGLSLPFQCTIAGMANGYVPRSTIVSEPTGTSPVRWHRAQQGRSP